MTGLQKKQWDMRLLAVSSCISIALASVVVITMSLWSYIALSLDVLMLQANTTETGALACEHCPSCHTPTVDRALSVASEENGTKLFEKGKKLPNSYDDGDYSNCSYVYLDVGTNIGVQIRKLFEPARYPKAPVLPIFDQQFGTNRKKVAISGSLCVIGIEMNPSHTDRLLKLEKHYKNNCGYRVHIITETAASTFDGQTDFWSDGDSKRKEWGASTIMPNQDINAQDDRKKTIAARKSGDKKQVKRGDFSIRIKNKTESRVKTSAHAVDTAGSNGLDQKQKASLSSKILTKPTIKTRENRHVRALDLANFINSALAPHSKKIVMKLDIEGAEHNVLPRLIMTGAICHVDLVFMEQHMKKFTESQKAVFLQAKALFPHVARAAGCKAQLSMLDDETYRDDADDTINTC